MAKSTLFSDQACLQVYRFTGGVPRLINLLCDTALVYGYAEQREKADATLIKDVALDKQKGGLFQGQASLKDTDRDQETAPATKPPVGAPSSGAMEERYGGEHPNWHRTRARCVSPSLRNRNCSAGTCRGC